MHFLSQETLLKTILTIKKFQKNSFLIFQALAFTTLFVLVTPLQFPPTRKEGHQFLRPFDIQPHHVGGGRHSALTPHATGAATPSTRTDLQTPALFTIAQSSPQPQSVYTANYARVNPLPSSAISYSSSGELPLHIESDTSSTSLAIGQTSSSQELLIQGQTQVSQPPSHTVSLSQQPTQSTHIPSWADEVEKTGHSTPETVIPNWEYSSGIRGPRSRSQPLVYPPPVMPTPHPQRQLVSSLRNRPIIPPLRPQQPLPQPPTYERPTSMDNYPCTDPSPKRRPRVTAHEIHFVRSSPIKA